VELFGRVRTPSFRVTLQEIMNAAPEILLVSPCGYDAERAAQEYKSMIFPDEWYAIPAVRNGRVYALEANSYFSRSGPRLIAGLEALAKLFHSAIEVPLESEAAISPINMDTRSARAASA
jgi:iron complex transport system substrate-binding protein